MHNCLRYLRADANYDAVGSHQACGREGFDKVLRDQGVELWDECCWKMRIAIAWRAPCLLPCPDFHWAGCRDARAGRCDLQSPSSNPVRH